MSASRKPFEPTAGKVVALAALVRKTRALRRQGLRVVFTNGCYDLLHVGHVTLLEKARRLGDALVVGVNSDSSLAGLKGEGRPVTTQTERCRVLAGLACVDFVTVFDEPTPAELIRRLVPDVLVKGADWKANAIVGADVVKAAGGKIARIPLVKGRSTTEIIRRIRAGVPAR